MEKRNPIVQGVIAVLFFLFYHITACLPLGGSRWIGIRIARLAYYVIPRIRRIGLANLDIAYGDSLTKAEKKAILLESVDNLGLVAAEFMKIPKVVGCEGAAWFHTEGFEDFDFSRGAIFISGHMGNWEWLAAAASTLGIKPMIVVRGFDDPYLDKAVDRIRSAGNIKTVDKHQAVKPLVEHLKQGYVAGILADQSPRENGVPVTFFGKPAWATVGPAIVAQRSGAPVYPISMLRDEKGHYTLTLHPAIEIQSTGESVVDVAANTQRCQDAIEMMIRQAPGQWLWFHRRWRSRDHLAKLWAERIAKANGRSDTAEDKHTDTGDTV